MQFSSDFVEYLIRQSTHRDGRSRREACAKLGQPGNARAVEPLIARLDDEWGYVREAACEALAKLGDPRAVEPLIARLKVDVLDVRRAACEALGQLGEARAVEPLISRLEDEDWATRRAACEALGKLDDARAAGPLITRLDDQIVAVRWAACWALGKLGEARAVQPLIARLGDTSDAVRQTACEALGELGDASAVEPLTARWIEDTSPDVRATAREALGKLGDARAVEPLTVRLSCARATQRQAVADALRSLGEGRLVNAVVGAWDGRREAFEELERMVAQGDLRGIDPLAARVSDPDAAVRQAVAQALKRVLEPTRAQSVGLLCGLCLTRFEEKRSLGKTSWYACRVCGRAGKALVGVKHVVAVLDEEWNQEQDFDAGVLWVNWLKRRVAFDFHRVEVVRSSDYEVECFCVVIGNEADEFRQRLHKRVPWVVDRQCALSENTLRVLRSTFGPEER